MKKQQPHIWFLIPLLLLTLSHCAYKPPRNLPPSPTKSALRARLVHSAKSYLGISYRWGGTSARTGFDCSGLTMAVYRQNGITLPRTALAQYHAGQKVSISGLRKGDLLFFSINAWGWSREITHVGLYLGKGQFIHAPGRGKKVKIDQLSNYFRTHFVGARRYI